MIIGIAGPKRSGKDTLAAMLAAHYNLPRDSFAGPLREFVAHILGLSLEQLEEAKEIPVAWLDGVTPRKMMQTVGTEWGRDSIHSELWVRSLLNRIPPWGAVISDVRFPNEADAIHARGGVIIRLSRPGLEVDTSHSSEVPLPAYKVDLELANDGTPDQLWGKAVILLDMLAASA